MGERDGPRAGCGANGAKSGEGPQQEVRLGTRIFFLSVTCYLYSRISLVSNRGSRNAWGLRVATAEVFYNEVNGRPIKYWADRFPAETSAPDLKEVSP